MLTIEMIEELRGGGVILPPLKMRFLWTESKPGFGPRFDAIAEVSWAERTAWFAIEAKSRSTPRAFESGLNQLRSAELPDQYNRMLFLPYLNTEQLLKLEELGLSGIDLCGNGVVIVPGTFSVFRTGGANRFTDSASIKNVYRKNSSMVARAFLLQTKYENIREIREAVNRRNVLVSSGGKSEISLATVSKVVKTLEEDLIVEKNRDIRLLQADKLFLQLETNYEPPKTRETIRLRVPMVGEALLKALREQSRASKTPIVVTGKSAVGQYAIMEPGEMLSVYCTQADQIRSGLSGNESDRFPNLELVETDDEPVYFDARERWGILWASPIQTYLELTAGDKRDREVSEQVRSYILRKLGEKE